MALNFGRILLAAAIVAGPALVAGNALAQGRQAIAQHCREDLTKFCSGIKPGGGRLKPCVKENYRKFSPACQAALQDMVAEKRGGAPAQ